MGHVITLPGGENEIIIDTKRDFRRLVEKHMGYDAANLFDEIIKQVEEEIDDLYATGKRHPDGEDYEAISDGLRGLAVDTMNALKELLGASKIDRKRLDAIYYELERSL